MFTGTAVRFLIVIQYVMLVAFARSTSTSQSICGAPGTGEIGTTFHSTCHCCGQLKVNHFCVAFAATVPVNCTPTVIVFLLSLPSKHRIASLDIGGRGAEVSDVDPVGDVLIGRAFDLDFPPDLRSARSDAGRNHCPDHMPMSGPVESEPPSSLPGGHRSCELDADEMIRLKRRRNELPEVRTVSNPLGRRTPRRVLLQRTCGS